MKMIGNLLFSILLFSCKAKEEDTNGTSNKFVSIKSLIQKEMEHIDTSLYGIRQIETKGELSDTSFIAREDFKLAANDFLELPDISEKKLAKEYTEESTYDETLNKVLLIYNAKNPEKVSIKRQDIYITPNLNGGESEINSLIIDYATASKDSSVRKKMLWKVNESFLVTTILLKPNGVQEEVTRKVIWNE